MPLRNVQTADATRLKLNGKNRTGTHLSTNIIIAIGAQPVAAIKSLQVNESRSIQTISEVGTDGLIDSTPSKSTEYSISCTRTRFDGKRIAEGFYRSYVHVAAQRTPFDIYIYDLIQGGSTDGTGLTVTTVIENCWITKISYSFEAENFVIVDNMDLTAEAIKSFRAGGQSAISDPTRMVINPFEQEADRGLYRGALDGAGLINAFDGSNK
jgi:hypothetical protein